MIQCRGSSLACSFIVVCVALLTAHNIPMLSSHADTYQRVTGLFTYLPPPPADATPGGPNAPTSNTTLLMLWNTTAAGVTLPRAAQVTAASAGSLQQGAAINGVSLTAPGALSGLLLPPGVSSGSAVGLVGAALTVPSSPLGGWAFRVSTAWVLLLPELCCGYSTPPLTYRTRCAACSSAALMTFGPTPQ
jgi:hypothetical protein